MGLLVVDASALVEVLLRTPLAASLELPFGDPETDLHVPAICDLEVLSALRTGLQRGSFSVTRAEEALEDYLDLPLCRHGHRRLAHRCFQLRNNLSPYDASYVALAELLQADLLTADKRLARAAEALGVSCFSS